MKLFRVEYMLDRPDRTGSYNTAWVLARNPTGAKRMIAAFHCGLVPQIIKSSERDEETVVFVAQDAMMELAFPITPGSSRPS